MKATFQVKYFKNILKKIPKFPFNYNLKIKIPHDQTIRKILT